MYNISQHALNRHINPIPVGHLRCRLSALIFTWCSINSHAIFLFHSYLLAFVAQELNENKIYYTQFALAKSGIELINRFNCRCLITIYPIAIDMTKVYCSYLMAWLCDKTRVLCGRGQSFRYSLLIASSILKMCRWCGLATFSL